MASPTRPRSASRGRAVAGGAAALVTLALVGGLVVTLMGHGPLAPATCRATVGGTTVELSPEQMANAATIVGIAQHRGLPARAATIGIAAAMQESKLVNVNHGDRDSLGLFQQRPSQGWGTKEQVTDPVHATNAFYDVLVTVRGYRSLPITTAAQRVQRSAFPHAYARHESQARALASALSGYSSAALSCSLDADHPPAGPGGLTALRAVLGTEQARVAQEPLAGGAGLRLTPGARTTPTPERTPPASWSLAQWAVAQADRLGVARVYADGLVWRRSEPTRGWQTAHGAGVPTSGSRGVVVMLSDDDPA